MTAHVYLAMAGSWAKGPAPDWPWPRLRLGQAKPTTCTSSVHHRLTLLFLEARGLRRGCGCRLRGGVRLRLHLVADALQQLVELPLLVALLDLGGGSGEGRARGRANSGATA